VSIYYEGRGGPCTYRAPPLRQQKDQLLWFASDVFLKPCVPQRFLVDGRCGRPIAVKVEIQPNHALVAAIHSYGARMFTVKVPNTVPAIAFPDVSRTLALFTRIV
jgi:hypothetical protein